MKLSHLIIVLSITLASSVLNISSLVAQEAPKDGDITGVWYGTHDNRPLFITKKSKDTLRMMFLSSQYVDIPRDPLDTASYRYVKINPDARSGRGRIRNYRVTPRRKDTLEIFLGDYIFYVQRKNCQ